MEKESTVPSELVHLYPNHLGVIFLKNYEFSRISRFQKKLSEIWFISLYCHYNKFFDVNGDQFDKELGNFDNLFLQLKFDVLTFVICPLTPDGFGPIPDGF